MTFDLGIWHLTAWTHEGFHIKLIDQVWFKLGINFSNGAIFTFIVYLTTWPQMTFDLDMWPSSINKWGFPCCIYAPTLVEIHQSMWKLEPNVNLFSQQQTTRLLVQTRPTENNNSGQSDPYVSFLLRQATKKKKNTFSSPGCWKSCFLNSKIFYKF